MQEAEIRAVEQRLEGPNSGMTLQLGLRRNCLVRENADGAVCMYVRLRWDLRLQLRACDASNVTVVPNN